MAQLDPPANLVKVDWQTIAWDDVTNAVSYDIYFDGVYGQSVTDPAVSLQWAAVDVPTTGVEITVVAIAGGGDTDSDPSAALSWARDVWGEPGDEEQIDDNTLRIGGWGAGTPYPYIEVRINTVDVATITDYDDAPYYYDFSPDPAADDSVDYRYVGDGFDPSGYSTPIIWVTNQVPTLGGTNTGSVTEDGTATTTGTLTITDNDAGQSSYQATSGTGTYGTFALATDGAWTYTLNNSDTDTIALTASQTVTDVFVATSNDGSASQNVTITVTGANDSPTLGGTNTGTVIKDAATTTAGSTLTITDNDPGESSYQATSGTGTYGTFALATTGVWVYTLNNSDTDTQALTTGQITSDVFVATSNDGSASQSVTITVRESASATTNLAVFRYLMEIR